MDLRHVFMRESRAQQYGLNSFIFHHLPADINGLTLGSHDHGVKRVRACLDDGPVFGQISVPSMSKETYPEHLPR